MNHTRKLLILGAAVLGAAPLATAGWAYWSAGGSGSASATVGTLNAPVIGTSTQQGLGTLRVNWTASTGDVVPTGYYIQRYAGTTLDGYACGSSATTLKPAPSCDDQGLTEAGPYNYKVTAVFRSWTAQSAASNAVTVLLDATAPEVSSINRAGPAQRTNAASVSWTVTFSEAVSGVDQSDFALATSGISGASITGVTGTGAVRTVTASTGTGDGNIGLDLVDDDTIVDGVGNPLGGTGAANGNSSGEEYTIDKTAPTVVDIVRGNDNPTNAAIVTWTVTFSETIDGADASDFVLATGGVVGASITDAEGATFTVTATTGSGDGTLGLNLVDDDTIVDEAGNKLGGIGTGNGSSFGEAYTIDKTAPSVTINQAEGQADLTNSEPLNFTVVFSEPVVHFTGADVALSGTAGSVANAVRTVTGAGSTYNVAVSGLTASGTVTATVPAGGAQDAAGNDNAPSTSSESTVTLDVTAPTVTVNQAAGQSDPTKEPPINFTVVFSEPVTGFTGADVALSGTAGNVANALRTLTGTGTTYNVAVSGLTSDGTVVAAVLAGGTQDAAGNGNAASANTDNSVTVDTTGPTITSINRTPGAANPTNTGPLAFTVTFNEPVAGLAASNFTLATNGITGTPVITIPSGVAPTATWTVNVTTSGVTATNAGSIGLNLTSVGATTDAAGNALTTSSFTGQAYSYDTTPPALASLSASCSPTNGNFFTCSGSYGTGPTDLASNLTITIYRASNSTVLTGPVGPTSASGGTWSFDGSGIENKVDYFARITQSDTAGNATTRQSDNFRRG
jgi:hypothetical protein